MSPREHLASLSRPIRRRLGLVPVATVPPSGVDPSLSDLFVWRAGAGWTTHFEVLNLASLIDPHTRELGNDEVTVSIRDENGMPLEEVKLSVEAGRKLSIPISKDLAEAGLQRIGTFSVAHCVSPPRLVQFETFLTDRGYVGYSSPGQISKAYVHGNLDAIEHVCGEINPLGSRSFGWRQYVPQYSPEENVFHEYVLANPTKRTLHVEVLEIDGPLSRETARIEVSPLGTAIHSVHPDRPNLRYAFRSRLWLLRPTIFVHHPNGLDVFHG